MGLEYITQPQVFLAPITAVNGIQGVNNPYPLLTTYQSWVSTGTVNTSAFPIPGTWTMLDQPGSFIVTVGNVIQSPTDYSIDRNNRILTFSSIITAGVEVGVTQLATASPSATSFNYIESVSGSFVNLSAINGNITNLRVSSLTSLSAIVNIASISQNLTVIGSTVTNTISSVLLATNSLSANAIASSTLSSATIATNSLSSRFINLEHSVPNDGVNPNLFIGERGDGSSGTIAGTLTGYNITYTEPSNRLLITTQFGAVTPLTAISLDPAGNVGINTDRPNTNLTVVGNISASGNITGYNSSIYYHATGFGAAPLTITPFFSADAANIILDPNRRYKLNIETFYTKAPNAGVVTFTLSATVPFIYATGSLQHSAGTGYTASSGTPIHTANVASSAATLAFSPGSIGTPLTPSSHYGSFTYYIETSSIPARANLFVTTAAGGAINPGRGSYWQETVIG